MDVDLNVEIRNNSGKGPARSLRRTDRIPAVLYGPKMAPLSLSVPAKRLEKLLRDMGGESKLLRLNIEGPDETQMKQVLIREIQVHPVRRRFLHVDFYEVPLDHPIVVEVPVELTGECLGEKKGGTVNLIRRTLSVRCLPAEIPEKIHIDVSDLDLGGAIHVSDLVERLPFEVVDDLHHAVVNVSTLEGAEKEAEGSEAE